MPFIDLLELPLATIPPHVRYLSLQGCLMTPQDTQILNTIARLSRLFVSLKLLSLKSFRWSSMSPELWAVFLSSFREITILHLKLMHFENHRQLVDLIRTYPSLEELSIDDDVFYDSSSVSLTVDLPPFFRLLCLGTCETRAILSTFFGKEILRS